MHKILAISFSVILLCFSNILQASVDVQRVPGVSEETSEFLPKKSLHQIGNVKSDSSKVEEKNTSENTLKEGRCTTDKEALAAASRRADRLLGLKQKKRAGYREK